MIVPLEAIFQETALLVALGVEAAAMLCVAIGSIEAMAAVVRQLLRRTSSLRSRRDIWFRFATWILLALEFTLAADVVRTAVAPSWDDIGKLGAIAAIRTVLSFFLSKDIETAIEEPAEKGKPA